MTHTPRVSVVIPALNEESGVGETVKTASEALRTAGISFELIVVDDGSHDRTGELAAEAGARVLRHSVHCGYGASLLDGIRSSVADHIVILDADGTYPAEDIPKLLSAAGGSGLAVGVRRMVEKPLKSILRLAFRGLVRAVAGRPISDVNSGFRAFPRRFVLERESLFPSGFSFTTTLTLLTAWSDVAVQDVPIEYRSRKGQSKVRLFQDGLRAVRTVLRLTVRFRPARAIIVIGLTLVLLVSLAAAFYGGIFLGIR